jgi:Zn-dependent protease
MNMYEFGARIGLIYIPLLFSLCIHEYAHGLVAKWKGDNTADYQGRLNLNPLSHADMMGTFILPLSMLYLNGPIIGWGKPVPVDERNMKNPRVDMFWVACAGPISNLLMGIVGAIVVAVIMVYFQGRTYSNAIQTFFFAFIRINLLLAVFNLLPVHPLDGGKVLARFLPQHVNDKLEANQQISGMILMVLMFTGMLSFLFQPIGAVSVYLVAIVQSILPV